MKAIRPWLCQGSAEDAADAGLLETWRVGAMLQLHERSPVRAIESLFLPIEDGEPLPPETLRRGVEFIRAQKQLGRRVLVACGAGISRSSTLSIAALHEEEGLGLLGALRALVAAAPYVSPHPELWKSLCTCYGEEISTREMYHVLEESDRASG